MKAGDYVKIYDNAVGKFCDDWWEIDHIDDVHGMLYVRQPYYDARKIRLYTNRYVSFTNIVAYATKKEHDFVCNATKILDEKIRNTKFDADYGFCQGWNWSPTVSEKDAHCILSTANTESSSSDAFKQITDKMHETYKAKNYDYGNSFDKSMDEFGLTAAVVRMSDKLERLKTLSKKESMVKDESVQDTLLDLANYAIMTVMYLKKHEDKDGTDNK
jgi:hypothetical protein